MSSQGHLFFAQNTEIDYIKQAYASALLIKKHNKINKTCLVTNDIVPISYIKAFDVIVPFPWNDDAKDNSWKIHNRWKLIHCSPFDETIVYDTDMLLLNSNDHWWKHLKNHSIALTSKVYNYRADILDNKNRTVFRNNNLPDIYFGLHYFKKNQRAFEFYKWLELIVKNFNVFYEKFTPNNTQKFCSMDVNAAIATLIMNAEDEFTNNILNFIHMKSNSQNWDTSPASWQSSTFVDFNDDCQLKIGNFLQSGVFHYTEDSFMANNILRKIEEYCV